jgi:hypothetical protein
MRTAGLFLGLLLVWWAVNTRLLWYSPTATLSDFWLALAITLFFGSLSAIPMVGFLVGGDFLAGRFSFPWNVLIILAWAALGCALYAAVLRYWKGNPLPTTSEGWYYYRQQFIPYLACATVVVVKQLTGAVRKMG